MQCAFKGNTQAKTSSRVTLKPLWLEGGSEKFAASFLVEDTDVDTQQSQWIQMTSVEVKKNTNIFI